MKCSLKGCTCAVKEIMNTIDNGKEKIFLCPKHAILYALGDIKNKEIKKHPSEIQEEVYCEIDGEKAVEFSDSNVTIHLCERHLADLLLRDLASEDFHILYEKYGNIFLLHDDFYDDFGVAFQPIKR